MWCKTSILSILIFCCARIVIAQTCPDNIDFSENSFNHWECSANHVSFVGVLDVTPTGPVKGRHVLYPNSDTEVDPYGGFPVVAPNGAGYSIRLGNNQANSEGAGISYYYQIPANKSDYVITCYYAFVLQKPVFVDSLHLHTENQMPRFSIRVVDLTVGLDITCGTYNYSATLNTADLKPTPFENIYYHDWVSAALNLSGRAGHKIRLDFTSNGCSRGDHFGYGYLALDNPCARGDEIIQGNVACAAAPFVTLSAPAGFSSYNWHAINSTVSLGTDRFCKISPLPDEGAKYVVDVVTKSEIGRGCEATFGTTIRKTVNDYVFNLKPSAQACEQTGINLKDPNLTAGSTPNMFFEYFVDPQLKNTVRNPAKVTVSGRYYIQATSNSGCTDVKTIDLTLYPSPALPTTVVKNICKPGTLDLTDPGIVGGNNSGLNYKYYRDSLLSLPENNPVKISTNGTYYIKSTNALGCYQLTMVKATFAEVPVVNEQSISACSPLDLTSARYHADDTPGLTYTYWLDAKATVPFNTPNKVTSNGIYYVVGTISGSCSIPKPVPYTITIYPDAILNLSGTLTAKFPATVDLSKGYIPVQGYDYLFYSDSLLSKTVSNYKAVGTSAVYYIKAISPNGCGKIGGVKVTITEPDPANIIAVNTFTPNGDGINDEFNPVINGYTRVNYLKIYNRSGSLVFQTTDQDIHWKGTFGGQQLPAGTYYWIFASYDLYYKKDVVNSGAITLIR